jgi:hypothetical protein
VSRAIGDSTPKASAVSVMPFVSADSFVSFEATNEALAYVETGRAKGKVVVKVR